MQRTFSSGHAEHRRELLAQIVRRLRGGPAGELAVLELGDRAGRADRAVRVDGEIVGRGQRLGAAWRQRLVRVADIAGHVVLDDLGGADILPELRLLGQALPFRPGRLERLAPP